MVSSFTLQNDDTIISSGDQLGQIQWAASAESDTGAARLISAKIYAQGEGAFNSGSNPASIVFATSSADPLPASGRIRITDQGHILPMQDDTYDLGSPDFRFRDLYVTSEVISPTGVFDYIYFDTTVGDEDLVQGQMNWNSEAGTLELGLTDDLKIQIGQTVLFRVKNSTGSTLSKGQAVYASGVLGGGQIIQAAPFAADNSVDEVRFIGLMTDDLANGDDGFVNQFGHIKNVDLRTSNTALNPNGETWAVGDILFVDDSTPGGLTKIAPQDDIYVAMVLADGQNGELFVRITDPGHMTDLHDVNFSGLVDNNLMVWNSGSDYWEPASSLYYVDGNVGIGTSSPNATLHVYNSTPSGTIFNAEGTNGSLFSVVDNLSGVLMSVNTIAGLPVLEVNSDYSITAGRFNQNDFVITSSGNVGMGIAAPSGKLHVVGEIYVDNLKLDGNTLSSTDSNGNIYITPNGTGGIGGGTNSTVSGPYNIVAGGKSNVSSGSRSTVSGGQNNWATNTYSTVSGGYTNNAGGNGSVVAGGQFNCSNATRSVVSGGYSNNAAGDYAVIVGGYDNNNTGAYGSIGGGRKHCVSGTCATVGGGHCNTSSSSHSTVSGGYCNCASGSSSFIGGGSINCAACCYSAVVGGILNAASGDYSAIVAGSGSLAAGTRSFVGGGMCHTAAGITSFIGGGLRNTTSGYYNVVAGGSTNNVLSWFSAIGGGKSNTASSYYSTIAGGWANNNFGGGGFIGAGISNDIGSVWGGVIGGGADNTVSASYGTVVGGYWNTITASGTYSFIGGGCRNCITGDCSIGGTIGGGKSNQICCNSSYATIAGGLQNVARGTTSTIGGGHGNTASGYRSFIGGGATNCSGATGASIAAGISNTVSGYVGFIGGGRLNTARGFYGTVTGGCCNCIDWVDYGAIVGGKQNCVACCYGFIGGGALNYACGVYAAVVAGSGNLASGSCSFLGGGDNNTVSSCYSSVLGGKNNTVSNSYGGAILGGSCNNVTGWGYNAILTGYRNCTLSNSYNSVIAGGAANCTNGDFGFIGNGDWHSIEATRGFIGGGLLNRIMSSGTFDAWYGTIVNGEQSTIFGSQQSFIGNGQCNLICSTIWGCNRSVIVGGGYNCSINSSSSFIGGGDYNSLSSSHTVVGGGKSNVVNAGSHCSVIAGGIGNVICANSTLSTIGGGNGNYIYSSRGTIAGGCNNKIYTSSTAGTVSGGYCNQVLANLGFIGGGQRNITNGCAATVAGGEWNCAACGCSSVLGGALNVASGDYSAVVAGSGNVASGACSFIGGGQSNCATDTNSLVLGGVLNKSFGPYSVAIAGSSNCVTGSTSAIVGGFLNKATGNCSFVGAGWGNCATQCYSTVSAGYRNYACGVCSTVGGGHDNCSCGSRAVVSGGGCNKSIGVYSAVAGGYNNTSSSYCSFVGGGSNNLANGQRSTISGGYYNISYGTESSVGGGRSNCACGANSAIGGGKQNYANGLSSTIAGGLINTANGNYSTVAGGWCNCVTGNRGSILGGNNNSVSGVYSAILGGAYNDDSGKDAVFILGTGITATSANTTYTQKLNVSHTIEPSGTLFNVEGSNGSLFSVVDNLSGVLMSVNNNAGLPVFEVYDDDSIIAGRFAQNDFVISSGGDVGIGTANPSAKLHVSSSSSYATVKITAAANHDTAVVFDGDRMWTIQNDGNATLGSADYLHIFDSTANASRMTFNTAGYVGIGTTGPTQKLSVNGNIQAVGATRQILLGNAQGIQDPGNNDLILRTGGGEKIRILDGGNVGIGTTSPLYKLHVAGDISSNSANIYGGGFAIYGDTNNKLTKSGNDFTLSAGQTTTDVHLGYYNAGTLTKVLTVDSSENKVGILNTAPDYTLDVAGSGRFTGNLTVGGSMLYIPSGDISVGDPSVLRNTSITLHGNQASNKRTTLQNINGDTYLSYLVGSQNLHFGTPPIGGHRWLNIKYYAGSSVGGGHKFYTTDDNDPDMVITSDGSEGFVGINQTSPSYNLDVNGTSNLGGDVIVGGNLTVNGTTISTNVDTIEIQDPIITLGLTSGNIVTNDSYDRGIAMVTNDGTAFMGWDNSADKFVMLASGVATNGSGNYDAGIYGDLQVADITASGLSLSDNLTFTDVTKRISWDSGTEYIGRYSDGIIIGAQGTAGLYLNSLRNFGIGTTNPTAKLHVASDLTTYASSLATSVTAAATLIKNHATDSTVTSFGGNSSAKGYIQRSNGAGTGAYDLLLNPYGGNIGIGHSLPGYKLDVAGTTKISPTAATETLILGRSTGYASVTSTASNELILDSDSAYVSLNHYSSDDVILGYGGGNVGIGTTTPSANLQIGEIAYNQPEKKLIITGYGGSTLEFNNHNGWARHKLIGSLSSLTYINDGSNSGSTSNFIIGSTTNAASLRLYGDSNSTIQMGSNASYPIGYIGVKPDTGANYQGGLVFTTRESTSVTNQVYIDKYGQLGLGNGTNALSAKLDVRSSSSPQVNVGNTSAGAASAIRLGDTAVRFQIGKEATTHDLVLESLNGGVDESMRIDYGDGSVTFNETGADMDFRVEGSGSPNALFVNGANGNIGIGTATPLYPLQVSKDGGASTVTLLRLENANLTASQSLDLKMATNKDITWDGGSGGGGIFSDAGTNGFGWLINGSGIVDFKGDGKVGIGTSTPSHQLQVQSTSDSIASLTNGSYIGLQVTRNNTSYGAINVRDAGGRSIKVGSSHGAFGNSDAYLSDLANGLGAGVTLSARTDADNNHMSLRARGDVAFYTNTGTSSLSERMRISASGNVGVGTNAPTTLLDVNGVITANGGNSNEWNTAYSWGDHSSAGYMEPITLTRTIPTSTNSYVDIGSFSAPQGVINLDISISVATASFSLGKRYLIASNYSETAGNWRRVLPISDGGPYSNDFILEANHNGANFSLRIVRTSGAITGTAYVTILQLNNGGTTTFTSSTATGSTTAATAIFPSTLITMKDGRVGVNNDSPSQTLDIRYPAGGGMALLKSTDTTDGLLFGDIAYSWSNDWQGMKHAAMGGTSEHMIISNGTDTIISAGNGGSTYLRTGNNSNVSEIILKSTEVVINEGSNSNDFRVESNNNANMLFVDGVSDMVGIGTGSPSEKLHVVSSVAGTVYMEVENTATSASCPAGIKLTTNYAGTSQSSSIHDDWTGAGVVFKASRDLSTSQGGFSWVSASNTTMMALRKASGSDWLGIGTASPGATLDITQAGAAIHLNNTTANPEFIFQYQGTEKAAIRAGSGGTLGLYHQLDTRFHNSSDTEIVRFTDAGNVGIGTASPSTQLDVVGSGNFSGDVTIDGHLSAATKSFYIDHPTKEGKLQYGSLESPYHGVRLTGRGKIEGGKCVVDLPDYISALVRDDENVNIQLTNYKHSKILYVDDINIANNEFTVKCDSWFGGGKEFFWSFTAVRKDVQELKVEC